MRRKPWRHPLRLIKLTEDANKNYEKMDIYMIKPNPFVFSFLLGSLAMVLLKGSPPTVAGTQENDAVAVRDNSTSPDKPELKVVQSGPNIYCEQPTFNFGRAANHLSIEHKFILKNTGDQPLIISDIRRTCGCTVASIAEKVVPPAEETEVSVRLSLKGRNGRQQKAIIILSNDPDTPQLRLYMNGEAESVADIAPERLFFRGFQSSEAIEKTIDIRFKAENPVNITSLSTSFEQFSASHAVVEEGKAYRLTVRAQPQEVIGRTQDTLVVHTDYPDDPTLTIPLIIDVVGDLTYSPKKIILSQSEDPVTRIIVVSSNKRETEFGIEHVEPPNETVKVKVTPLGQHAYRIQLDNLVPTQDLTGKHVKITTSIAGMKEILVPCVLIAPPRAPDSSAPRIAPGADQPSAPDFKR